MYAGYGQDYYGHTNRLNGDIHRHLYHHAHDGSNNGPSNGHIVDGYHNDYGYNSNNDLILVTMGGVFSLMLIALMCCICVIIACLAGYILHKSTKSQYVSKESRSNRYQRVVERDIDQI